MWSTVMPVQKTTNKKSRQGVAIPDGSVICPEEDTLSIASFPEKVTFQSADPGKNPGEFPVIWPAESLPTPAGGPALDSQPIADAWVEAAPDLAIWADNHLVNRRDAFGRYKAVELRANPKDTACTDKNPLTLEVLERHFQGRSTGDLIGLYTTVRVESEVGAVGAPAHRGGSSSTSTATMTQLIPI